MCLVSLNMLHKPLSHKGIAVQLGSPIPPPLVYGSGLYVVALFYWGERALYISPIRFTGRKSLCREVL